MPRILGRDRLFILAFLVPIVILVAILVYLPAADTLRASFTNQNLRLANKPIEWVGTANYEKLLGDDEFWEVTLRSLFLVLIVVPLEIVLAFGAALLLNEQLDRKSTRLNSSHSQQSRMPSSA